jgi:hypothetical protein
MGFIYGVETDEGQTFFTAGGNINHLTDEELNYIAGSFGTNAEPGSLVEDTGQTDISYDLNGVLLTGTFSDRVGLMDSIDYSYAYADTDNFSEREPYFANPYSGVVGKYNVYALPEGTTLNEFLGVYPDSFEYSGQEAILDKSGGEWYCLDKECNTGDYNKTSLFVLIQADESIVFQIWYSDNIIKEDLIRGLSTVTTDIGESAYGSIPDSMAELYAEPVADEATPTDAAVELDIPSGDSGDGASDEKTVDVDVDGEILQLTPSDNYTED